MENLEIAQKEITQLFLNELSRFSFPCGVENINGAFGGKYLKIWFSCSTKEIHNVRGQYPQVVSFCLDEKLILQVQHFGGMGGQKIYREINVNDEKEKYYAMIGIKIPFRKPQPKVEKIVSTLSKFIENYKQTLKDNIEVLRYKDLVNYEELLNH